MVRKRLTYQDIQELIERIEQLKPVNEVEKPIFRKPTLSVYLPIKKPYDNFIKSKIKK